MNKLYITDSSLIAEAQELKSFVSGLQLVTKPTPDLDDEIHLRLDSTGLAIASPHFKLLPIKDIYSKLIMRCKNYRDELLYQAVKKNANAVLYDLTAGLGKDSCILAYSGFKVTMVEQNPLLATILYYALKHKLIPNNNLNLVYANSINWLSSITTRPEIIYIDPMFDDKKSAKPNKEMQLIGGLANNITDNDYTTLFHLAYQSASVKIIVKRDNKQNFLVTTVLPTYSKQGKTIRLDVYNR